MDILFFLAIQLFIGGIITFCVFAFIQFLLPKFNVLYVLGILYVIGSAFVISTSRTHEWLLFTILASIALFAILTVRFYRYIYEITEQKANELREI